MSRLEEYLTALLNGETVNIEPRSRLEKYLKNCCDMCGCDGLPTPRARAEVLLYQLAEKLAGGGGSSGGGGVSEGFYDGSVTELNLPNITSVKEYACYKDKSIIKAILSNVETIGQYAFSECGLVTVDMPKVKEIGKYAFAGTFNVDSVISISELPNGLTKVDERAFSYCNGITKIKFLGATVLHDMSFGYCKNLTEVTFTQMPPWPYINVGAFSGCTNLTTINVPWAKGAVSSAPWGATNATINYNYKG